MAQISTIGPLVGHTEVTLCPLVIVRKAPVIISQPKQKELNNSQQILFTLLEKRFKRYVAAQRTSEKQRYKSGTRSSEAQDRVKVQAHQTAPEDSSINGEDKLRQPHRSKSIVCLRHRKKSFMKETKAQSFLSPLPSTDQITLTSNNALGEMGCAELAEHVVCRAKNRLKQRPKQMTNQYYGSPKTSSNLKPAQNKHEKNHETSCRSSTAVTNKHQPSPMSKLTPGCRRTISPAIDKGNRNPLNSTRKLRLSQPPRLAGSFPTSAAVVQKDTDSLPEIETCSSPVLPLTTVYLSERHSVTPGETGIPNVPPPTPSNAHSRSFKYIQSMHDIKSQRQLKNRLHDITHRQHKEATLSKSERRDDQEDKRKQREAITILKAKQRAEIYALNAAMRKYEENKFVEFMSGKV